MAVMGIVQIGASIKKTTENFIEWFLLFFELYKLFFFLNRFMYLISEINWKNLRIENAGGLE